MLLAGADAKDKESLDRPIVGSLVVLLVFKMIHRSTYRETEGQDLQSLPCTVQAVISSTCGSRPTIITFKGAISEFGKSLFLIKLLIKQLDLVLLFLRTLVDTYLLYVE